MLNVVIIEGNLTRDPDKRHTPTGKVVHEFTIASTEKWKDDEGRDRERTVFVGCVLWGKSGETFATYHKQGRRAIVEGKLVQEEWVDKETNKKRSKTKVAVERWHFAGGKPNGSPTSAAPANGEMDHLPEPPEGLGLN